MSDAAADYSERMNLAEIVARIERAQAETRKFVAEHDKLAAEQSKFMAEHGKLSAEQFKLNAEALKLGRDRFLAPFALAVTSLGAGAALFAAAQALLRLTGPG